MSKKLFSKFQDAELNKKAMSFVSGGIDGETDKSQSTYNGKDCTDPTTDLNKDNVATDTTFDAPQTS